MDPALPLRFTWDDGEGGMDVGGQLSTARSGVIPAHAGGAAGF